MNLLEPQTLLNGRYRIVARIGQGGMGAVYEAIDERLRTKIALKQTLVADEQFSRAFEREAQLLAGLRHPALPRVIDHFVDDQGQFLVMDYVEGDDLAALIRQRNLPYPPDRVLAWADQLLDALEYLHTRTPPVIHRDIKPQNIKLTPSGAVVLLDFGLAKSAIKGADTRTASIFAYTPQYAPLEQVQGTGTDERADIYSLAATLYHLLTGTPPPDVLSRAAAVLNRRPDPLERLEQRNPELSPLLGDVLETALAIAADERFASTTAFRRALRAAAENRPSTDRPNPMTGATILQREPATPDRYNQPTVAFQPPSQPAPARQTTPPPAYQPPPPPSQPPPAYDDPYTRARNQPPSGQLIGPGRDELPKRGKTSTGCCLFIALLFVAALGGLAFGVNRLATFAETELPGLVQSIPAGPNFDGLLPGMPELPNIDPNMMATITASGGEVPAIMSTIQSVRDQVQDGEINPGTFETVQAVIDQLPPGIEQTVQSFVENAPNLVQTAEAIPLPQP